MFTCVRAWVLSEGADRVGGQRRGDKECPFSGVTKSGRVWRTVAESGARSVGHGLTVNQFTRWLCLQCSTKPEGRGAVVVSVMHHLTQ